MTIRTTCTTDPKTGHYTSITVQWVESESIGILSVLWLCLSPYFIYDSLSSIWLSIAVCLLSTFCLFCVFSYIGSRHSFIWINNLIVQEKLRSLTINDDGTLYAKHGVWKNEKLKNMATRFEQVTDIRLDQYINWMKREDVENKNKSESLEKLKQSMVILLEKSNGQIIFLSNSRYDRATLSPIPVALKNAFREMKPYVKAYQKQQQSKQGVDMTVGDNTVHVNPL